MQQQIDFTTKGDPASREAPLEAVEQLAGWVHRIIYHSDESGYTVCGVIPKGKTERDEVIVVGSCPAVWEGESLAARGRWIQHKQHGTQFQASEIVCHPPATVHGIERFLASGMIRGIGKVMAERLVREFGDKTLEIIDHESKRLEEVEGIGRVRREMIKESWNEKKSVRDIMVFLQSHGVGTAHAMRIHRQYGAQAVTVVRENPYRLCQEVWGIGFKTADGIAVSLGVPPQSEIRARAGILYLLQTMTEEGHCYCPRGDLVAAAEQLLEIPGDVLKAAIVHCANDGTVVDERGNLFLTPLHHAELGVATNLQRLMEAPAPHAPIQAEKAVAWAEGRMAISFAPAQQAALIMALSQKVSVITGGPGVGKTTIVRALVDIFQTRRLKMCLAAPTGRAAKRMEEATRLAAKTLHRLLKFNPNSGRFECDSQHPLEGDVFILDEVSMIDIQLMHAFLRALPAAATLVLVGDADQLPSVGPGNVLRDLIESRAVPLTKLETIFRQQAQSWIVHNAHRVNDGLPFELPPEGQKSDFYFIQADTPDDAIAKMLELVTERIPRRFHFDPLTEVQVLTPMRRNQLGCENLNGILQEALNPGGHPLKRFGRQYKAGDRVLQVRNNYDKDVFNGDIGIIDRIDAEAQEVWVRYEGRFVAYTLDELDELDLAYACSVHKSQGSEYPAVVLLMTTQHYKLLQRNLLYTAMTRGRKLVCLVGSHKAVNMAIRNDHVTGRRTTLRDRLKGLL
ncbi:MAG: ATP-dependent RecD-like DNA helicase [bacterium]